MSRPKLRDVEVIPVKDDMFALRDPLKYSEKILIVPHSVLSVIALLDGKRSLLDIQYEFTRLHGETLLGSQLQKILESLGSSGFLEGEAFETMRRVKDDMFKASGVRREAHAGSGYEEEPAALRRALDGYLSAAAHEEEAPDLLRAVIAPHIDINRGARVYGSAYSTVARRRDARLIVILGISHAPMKNRYALTKKDFATPLGALPTDRDAVARLAESCLFDPFEDELLHRHEHSLEFQAVFLRHILGEEARIVPVLCGAFLSEGGNASPRDDPQVSSFQCGLKRLIADREEEALLIAGADLCHVGPRFGDAGPFTPEAVEAARRADFAMLETVLAADADGFISFIRGEGDRRRVCGVPAIYTLLRALQYLTRADSVTPRGRLLDYDMAVDGEAGSAVGFSAVSFFG
jgi:AmmeMemoRadiSam system protein B